MGHGSNVGLAVAWRFLVSRLVIGVVVEVVFSRFLDRLSGGVARLLRFFGAQFGGSCDGGTVAWV